MNTSAPLASPARGDLRGWAMLVASNVLFAGAYVSGKVALAAVSPVTLNGLRFALAGTLLIPVLWRGRAGLRLARGDWLTIGGIAFSGFVCNKLFEYWGLSDTTASDGALLIASEGVFTAALSWLVLRERATWVRGGGLLLGFFGAYLVVERGLWPHLASASGHLDRRILGDALFALSLVFEAVANVISKRLTGRVSPLLVTALAVTLSLGVWLPAGGVDIALHGLRLTGPATVGVVYLAVFVTIAGYFLWFGGLQRVDGSAAAVTLFIQPLVGTLLAVWLLGDALSVFTLLGGACILLAVGLISRAASAALAPELPPDAP